MSKRASMISSFKHAFDGLFTAFRQEPNFKFHVFAGITVVILAGILQVSRFEWLILIFTIFFVLMMELLNTVLEAIVDLVQPDFHKKAKIAKDVAASGVLLAAIVATIVAIVIFVPAIQKL